MHELLKIVLLGLCLLQIAACGQTGALVLPGTQPAAEEQPEDEDEENSNQ